MTDHDLTPDPVLLVLNQLWIEGKFIGPNILLAALAERGYRVSKEGAERTFGPCSKCGGTDIHVAFHDGKGEKFYPGTIVYLACEHSKPCGLNGKAGEHLAVHCRRCGLDWFEKPGAAQLSQAGEKP